MRIRHLVPVLLLAVVCLAGLSLSAAAFSPDKEPGSSPQRTYIAIPEQMEGGIYFLDLNRTRDNWINQAYDVSTKEGNYVKDHFDRLLAQAIGLWKLNVLKRYEMEIFDTMTLATEDGSFNRSTTGLIIFTRPMTPPPVSGH